MTTTRRRRALGASLILTLLLVVLAEAPAAPPAAAAPAGVTASASSTQAGSSTRALLDGDVAAGEPGTEWRAGPGGQPWVRLTFAQARSVASVQVLGPSEETGARGAALHGVLRFSDGSTVPVAGIDAGAGAPTTVAFKPRTTDWVQLDLLRTAAGAVVALQELAVYDAATTPPRWPATGATYAITPPAASCRASAAVPPPKARRLTLVCPKTGTTVKGDAVVVVSAKAGQQVAGYAWDPDEDASAARRMARAVADGSGRAVLRFSTDSLPRGPFALKVVAVGWRGAHTSPLYVQLVNAAGAATPAAVRRSSPPDGMTLRWDEDFDGPLSVSATGAGAEYAAAKPESRGMSQYGDAVFADPAAGADALGTVPGGYLRVRAEPIGGRSVNATWGQRHLTGFLSSSREGGSGFSAQYGYFEARMLGAPGRGAWPAFWMLDSEAATPRQKGAGEIDAVELYGHSTKGSCHTVHDWGRDTGKERRKRCPDPNGFTDWALAWHTYGVQVTPSETIFFIDGVEVHRLGAISHQSDPYFFMVNLALGGGYPVDLARTGGVTDLYVDWVRVYT